jgi:hypothetical protein
MRVLETSQQYLALVPGEYRMTSNQDERGFAAVTSTFFLFSPRPHYMMFFCNVLIIYSGMFWLDYRRVLRISVSVSSLVLVYCFSICVDLGGVLVYV